MDKKEKLNLMEKMVRQLEDLVNSETAVVRKIGQMEAENINKPIIGYSCQIRGNP